MLPPLPVPSNLVPMALRACRAVRPAMGSPTACGGRSGRPWTERGRSSRKTGAVQHGEEGYREGQRGSGWSTATTGRRGGRPLRWSGEGGVVEATGKRARLQVGAAQGRGGARTSPGGGAPAAPCIGRGRAGGGNRTGAPISLGRCVCVVVLRVPVMGGRRGDRGGSGGDLGFGVGGVAF